MKNLKENVIGIIVYVTVFSVIMIAVSKVTSTAIETEVEVIKPDSGVKCVVVSRMFMVSTDCWND